MIIYSNDNEIQRTMHTIVQFKKEKRERICTFPDVGPKMINRLFLGGLITADFYFLPFVIHIV